MSRKANKLISQERREDYGEEATEGATVLLQGNEEPDGVNDKLEEACAEENAFDASPSEESAARARSHGVGNLDGHATGTANEIKEEKEEDNTAGNRKQPARNPVRGGHGW